VSIFVSRRKWMASLSYTQERGLYRAFFVVGGKRKSEIVGRIPPGTPRPRRDPPDVLAGFEAVAKREREAKDSPGTAIKLETFFEEYEENQRKVWRPQTLSGFRFPARRLCAAFPGETVGGFTREMAQSYVDGRLLKSGRYMRDGDEDSGVAASTMRTEIVRFSGAWEWGIKRGYISENPWGEVEINKAVVEPPRPSWTPDEYERLAANSPPHMRRILVVGCHTGMRIGEIIEMRWSWLRRGDGKGGSIVVPASVAKSKRSRRIPLHSAAAKVLREIEMLGNGDPVFRGPRGGKVKVCEFSKWAKRATEKANLPRVGSHAMRRTFGRWAVLGQGPWEGRPVSPYVVSKLLGHSSLATTELYLALDDASADEWMEGG
jgi:integrase